MPRRPIRFLVALAVAVTAVGGVATAHDPYVQHDAGYHGSPASPYGDYSSARSYDDHRHQGGYGGPYSSGVSFDERYYLQQNPDVVRSIQAGGYRNGYDHYLRNGRIEGRSPAPGVPGTSGAETERRQARYSGPYAPDVTSVPFDERYYLRQNPDVARAIRSGEALNAYDHYLKSGRIEGRSPAPGIPGTSTAGHEFHRHEVGYGPSGRFTDYRRGR